MAAKNGSKIETKEVDPWWAKYWYASIIAAAIWMAVAIYGAVNYELEMEDARFIVREIAEDPRALGNPICQIELWWVVFAVPVSLVIVNVLLAYFTSNKSK